MRLSATGLAARCLIFFLPSGGSLDLESVGVLGLPLLFGKAHAQ